MTEETKRILSDAISDVGYLRWWTAEDDICQIEFGGVQLLDEGKDGKLARSSVIALRFTGKSFIIFLDNLDKKNDKELPWYDKLHNDQIEPFSVEHEEFVFDNSNFAKSVSETYRNRKSIPDSIVWQEVEGSTHLLAVKCHDVGLVIGGSDFLVVGRKSQYTDEEIKQKSRDWWAYWKEYWNFRETDQAYDKDYACEVTIPIKE